MGRKWTIRLWTAWVFVVCIISGLLASTMPILTICLCLFAFGCEVGAFAYIRHRKIPGIVLDQTWRQMGLSFICTVLAVLMLGGFRVYVMGVSPEEALMLLPLGVAIFHFQILAKSNQLDVKVTP